MTSISQHLKCIVGGFKAGGTTFLNSVLAAHPKLLVRYETGVLTATSPEGLLSQRERTKEVLMTSWNLDEDQFQRLSQQDNFDSVYALLKAWSGHENTDKLIVDKYPDYCQQPRALMERTQLPMIIVIRDICALYWSRTKRELRAQNLPIQEKYRSFAELPIAPERLITEYWRIYGRIVQAKQRYPSQLLIVNHEKLVQNFESERQRIFEFLNLETPKQQLGHIGQHEARLRAGIAPDTIDEFRTYLSVDTENKLRRSLSDLMAEKMFD